MRRHSAASIRSIVQDMSTLMDATAELEGETHDMVQGLECVLSDLEAWWY